MSAWGGAQQAAQSVLLKKWAIGRSARSNRLISSPQTMNFAFMFFSLLVSLTHWVLAQQSLEAAQHAALMSVYDGLGSSALREHLPTQKNSHFFVVRFLQDALDCVPAIQFIVQL
jgi:hypothetical protein